MRFARVVHRFAGVHNWPGAPEAGVHGYLRHPHRHLFHVSVWIEQTHDDREIEYLEFRDWLRGLYSDGADLGAKSCEMIANEIRRAARSRWGAMRTVRVEVLEDGENGAYIE